MKRMFLVVIGWLLCASLIPAQTPHHDDVSCQWIVEMLRHLDTLHAASTRGELEKYFEGDGGISLRTHRTYHYRKCAYLKVDVDFAPAPPDAKSQTGQAGDRIEGISRPYVALAVTD